MPLVHKAYKFRFYPTPEQEAQLRRVFGCVRFVYNKALEMRMRAWKDEQRFITWCETSRALSQWRASEDFAFLQEVSRKPLEHALKHLDFAYREFFAKRAKHPQFKCRRSAGSAIYLGDGLRLIADELHLGKIKGAIRIVWSCPIPEGVMPSRASVSVDAAGRWFVSFLCAVEIEPLPETTTKTGLDAGLESLASLSTGDKISNPRYFEKHLKRLQKVQRCHARKQLGSSNRVKSARKVARVHAKIADARKDHLHKLSTHLVRENQTVVVETLNVDGMKRNHRLARAISDASWSELIRQLAYKCRWYGREFVKVDRWLPSSKTCSSCGHKMEKMPLKVRRWECPGCGASHDRDVNAARNILAAGLAVGACGGEVRPMEPPALEAEPMKQERKGATPELPGLWA